MEPTLAGFLSFIRNVMRVPVDALPDNSPVIGFAFNVAMMTVNEALQVVGSPWPSSVGYPTYYAMAVNNLAADRLVNYAEDVDGQTYWTDLRTKLNLDGFVAGVISSTFDDGTGQSMEVPEAMKGLTFDDLQTLKTPWGRRYLGLAQAYGPTIWGVT